MIQSEDESFRIGNLADDVVADQETECGGEHPNEGKLQERRQPPGNEDAPLNEPPLKEQYDRNLNEVDGVDVFSECRLNASSRTWLFLLVDHFSADPQDVRARRE
jgi:hypothetical protein